MEEQFDADRAGPGRAGRRRAAAEPLRRDVSTREAAARLGITERSVRYAIARGDLPATKRGAYRITAEALAGYAARAEQSFSPQPVARVVILPDPLESMPPLPAPVSSFVGREEELARLADLLVDPANRLVTLTGAGGIGKTRLAIAAAATVRDRFPDGVVFVALAAVSQVELVLPAVADALGVREVTGRDRRAQLRAFLRSKRLLLVLDNFEQVLAAAPEIAQLTTQAAGVTLLVTSRAPLRVHGEREMPVPPLPLPSSRATPDQLLAADAGRLFVERAKERDPAFAVDAQSAPVIADICARLDGLPLAIELAAARAKILSPRQLRDRLEPRLALLTRGDRDVPPRHLTMRDAIAWSYDLLTPDEQRLFRRLAVFVDGCTLEAAEYVEGDEGDAPATLDLLGELVDQSVLHREVGLAGEPRYRMLGTIHEFGLERQAASGEADATRDRHAAWCLDLAEQSWQDSMRGARRGAMRHLWVDRLAAEQDNMRAALAWLERDADATRFVRLAGALYVLWIYRDRGIEGREWLQRALARGSVPNAVRARALQTAAVVAAFTGEHERMVACHEERLALSRQLGDRWGIGTSLHGLGEAALYRGEYERSEALLTESLPLLRDAGGEAWVALTLYRLGLVAHARGDLARAAVLQEESLARHRTLGDPLFAAASLDSLGAIACDRGDLAAAASAHRASLPLWGEAEMTAGYPGWLVVVATLAVAGGRPAEAARLFGAAEAMLEHRSALGGPTWRQRRERAIAAARAELGDGAFGEAQEAGWALTSEAAIAEALALLATLFAQVVDVMATVPKPERGQVAARAGGPFTLTRRESQVLALLVEGQTDREIAAALSMRPRTASWHVRTILDKLGVSNRRQAIATARAGNLV